ncbi:MAG: hypothetical protein ACWGMZ_02425 [Thermoguttaceae bacterium]
MNPTLFATLMERLWNADIWYSLPLIVAVSLVYAATRNEEMDRIIIHAVRFGLWIITFMALFFVLLWWLSG